MNIPAANIIVSFTKEPMTRLFAEGATFQNLIEGIQGNEDVLLFNNQANPNFIEFEHSFGGGSKGNIMKLTLIDPKGEFEKRFMMDNSLEMMGGYLSPGETNSNDNPIEQIQEDEQRTQLENQESFAASYRQAIRKFAGKRKLYVAYGLGKNLEAWSGPHSMVLLGADIKTKGAKKIMLKLGAEPNTLSLGSRRGMYNEPVSLDLEGLSLEVDAKSKLFDFSNFDKPEKVIYAPEIKSIVEAIGDFGYPDLAEEEAEFKKLLKESELFNAELVLEKIDFHLVVTDIIRSFIQKATRNPNVIVLLPNINLISKYAIDEVAKVERLNTDETTGTSVAAQQTSGGTSLDEWFGYYGATSPLGKLYSTVKQVIHMFCLSMDTQYKNPKQALRTSGSRTLTMLQDHNSAANFSERVNSYIYGRNHYATKTFTDNSGFMEYDKGLKNITDGIKKTSKSDYLSNITTMYESDTKLIDYWTEDKFTDIPLFGGAGKKFVSDKSVVIFGDQQLIRDYLYGSINLKQKEAQVSDLKDKAAALAEYQNIDDVFEEEHPYGLGLVPATQVSDFQNQGLTGTALTEAIGQFSDTLAETQEAEKQAEQAAFLQNSNITAQDVSEYNPSNFLDGAALLVPLHPFDKAVLAHSTYNDQMTELLHPSKHIIGPFGDVSYVPDEFAHTEETLSPELENIIQEKGIPVFRYNTTNPNVLDLKFKFGSIYFAQLELGFKKEIDKKVSSGLAGALQTRYSNFNFQDLGAVVAYIRRRAYSLGQQPGDSSEAEIIQELTERFGRELGASVVAGSTPEEKARAAYAYYLEVLSRDDRPMIQIDQLMPGNPIATMSDFSEQMYRKALQLSITTLPTFHLSTYGTMASPCLLFAQDQDITQTIKPSRGLINSFFSGAYKILGWKHKVTTSNATSEFTLVKNTQRATPKTEDPSDSLEAEAIAGPQAKGK